MCFICDRIEMIKNGSNPYFVKELDTEFTVFSCDKWGTVLSCK